MLRAMHTLRRPVVIIWFLALFTTAVSLVSLAASPLSSKPLLGAGVIVLLLILGDLASVELEDGSALTRFIRSPSHRPRCPTARLSR